MEKIRKGIPGFGALLVALAILILNISLIIRSASAPANPPAVEILFIALGFIAIVVVLKGLIIVQPNYAVVLTFFGKYVGTVKENGLLFVNPLFTQQKVNLRSQSLESAKLKVNDKMGNPIEIAAVILWQIQDTYKVVFDVVSFSQYMINQSEAAFVTWLPPVRMTILKMNMRP